jgi:hypothetical protein
MNVDELKQLVADAAEARATRNFPDLIDVEQVRAEPIVIDKHSMLRVVGNRLVRYHETGLRIIRDYEQPCRDLVYVPGASMGGFMPLLRVIMPRENGGPGFVLAGGALHSSLTPVGAHAGERLYRPYESDLDFFPVGLTQARANLLVSRLLSIFRAGTVAEARAMADWVGVGDEEIADALGVAGIYPPYGIYRTPNAVTITLDSREIQLITRLYPTRAAVIRDFDIGPAQVLWDGFRTWVTELGALAYSTGCFPLELDHCLAPTTYARRLDKYLSRGYTLLLLDADISRLADLGGEFRLPGIFNSVEVDGLVLTCSSSGFSTSPEDEQDFWPVREGLEVLPGDPWEFVGWSSTTDEPGNRHGRPVYLYRVLDYNPTGTFIANLLSWLKEEESQRPEGARRSEAGWRVCYYSEGQGWVVCHGIDRERYQQADVEELRVILGGVDTVPGSLWMRAPLTRISPTLDPEAIYHHVHAALGRERASQEIEWSYEPPRGIPIDPDAWYGPLADRSWFTKAAHR